MPRQVELLTDAGLQGVRGRTFEIAFRLHCNGRNPCKRYAEARRRLSQNQSGAPGKSVVGSPPRRIAPPRTGWSEAVTRLRLPRNVACGSPAPRSSEVDLQRSDRLPLPIWEIQLWSQQRRLRHDLVEPRPSKAALPAPAAKHLVPVALHGPIHLLQGAEISGNAKISVVSAK